MSKKMSMASFEDLLMEVPATASNNGALAVVKPTKCPLGFGVCSRDTRKGSDNECLFFCGTLATNAGLAASCSYLAAAPRARRAARRMVRQVETP